MTDKDFTSVQYLTIDADMAGQRLDNFLIGRLKGAPKTLIYRIIRKGEVRVNKKRAKADQKLQAEDIVRVPPVRLAEDTKQTPSPRLSKVAALNDAVVFEDDYMMVINKPSGLAVHGGSGLQFGLIEGLRALRPEARFLELVHRLDRDTSGLLMVAKKRSALRTLHAALRDKTVEKYYLTLCAGHWPKRRTAVNAPLQKNVVKSGERIVRVNDDGKASLTRFKVMQYFAGATLLEAFPVTGRTHQIRVHALAAGHAVAGDAKYSDDEFNAYMKQQGLKRLFLHATRLCFEHPKTGKRITLEAPLDGNLKFSLQQLEKQG